MASIRALLVQLFGQSITTREFSNTFSRCSRHSSEIFSEVGARRSCACLELCLELLDFSDRVTVAKASSKDMLDRFAN